MIELGLRMERRGSLWRFKMIKVASLFDGIGGTLLSATMCGIEPVWASEIEPFPNQGNKAPFSECSNIWAILQKINGAEVDQLTFIRRRFALSRFLSVGRENAPE